MESFVIWVTSFVFCVCLIQFISADVYVSLYRRGSRSVPQDITSDVTHLKLFNNFIRVLYSTCFSRYENLTVIDLSDNPIWKINNGVFDNNPLLKRFSCDFCNIEVLPISFGPSTNKIYSMSLRNGLSKWRIFTNFLTDFTSLENFDLSSSDNINIDDINFSPSLKNLDLRWCLLSHFPNMSSMPKDITYFSLMGGGLKEIGDVTVMTNLEALDLAYNFLETVPDMLEGLPRLTHLQIRGQGRLSCDQRMCWRRLWNRVRAPLVYEDDVMCKGPPEIIFELFRIYPDIGPLSLMDPGFMQCNQGEVWC